MADRYIGIDRGWNLEQFTSGGFKGVTTGTLTTSKGIELRYTTGVGINKQDLLNGLEQIKTFIEQNLSLEVA